MKYNNSRGYAITITTIEKAFTESATDQRSA